jgi:hypothetical protein
VSGTGTTQTWHGLIIQETRMETLASNNALSTDSPLSSQRSTSTGSPVQVQESSVPSDANQPEWNHVLSRARVNLT